MSDIKMSDAFSLPISGDSIEFYCKSSKGGSFDFDENCVAHAINSHDKLTEQNKMLKVKVDELQEALNRAPSIERNKHLRKMKNASDEIEMLRSVLWNLFVMCGKHPTILKIAHKEVTEAGTLLLKYSDGTFKTLESARADRSLGGENES